MNPIQASLPLITPPGLSLGSGPELTSRAEALEPGKGKSQIEKMASEFESVFVSLMLKEMRNTLDSGEGGLFGGEGSDTFGGMFDLFMGQHLAEASPLGIADAIKGFLNNIPRELGQELETPQIDETG
jgi:Rod binding domain-containing protein